MGVSTAVLPFVKIAAAFVLMLTGMRVKVGLTGSILIGGVVLGLMFGVPLPAIIQTGMMALTGERFLFLLGIVALIMILSDGLERTGQSRRLMDAVSGYLVSPKLRLIFFPALIGLLPMPGGAIFSAPMVSTMGAKMNLGSEQQAAINYWFRHVWEVAWPLYPGIILTVALAGIPVTALIEKTWPGVAAMLLFGWFFLLRLNIGEEAELGTDTPSGEKNFWWVIKEGLPLLVAIAGAIAGELLLAAYAPHIPFEWGVIAALAAAVLAIVLQNSLRLDFFRVVLGKKSLWAMLLVLAAIFIFKDILQSAGIVEEMASAACGGVALFAAAVFLPFLVGLVAGINVAFVGATFPLLIGLLQNLGLHDQLIAYLVLATFAGFTGVMISPIHICFVLTCNYFEANVAATWKQLVLPCSCFAITGAMLFLLLL